jgi:hypothetical protein
MKISRFLVLFALFSILCGCQSVESYYLVGEAPSSIEPGKWNGKWMVVPSGDESEVVEIQVLDAQTGTLRISWTEKDGEAKAMNCFLRGSGDWMFANLSEPEKAEYLWGRVKNSGDGLILAWPPSFEKFKDLVEKGALPGEVRGSTVYLKQLQAGHLKLIQSDEHAPLFEWTSPMVLTRPGKKPPLAEK